MKNLNINTAIKKAKVSKILLAKIIGCNPQWLTNAEHAEYYPKTLKLIDGILKASGMTYEELTATELTEEQKHLEWIDGVIKSCKTEAQLENAYKLKENYENQNK